MKKLCIALDWTPNVIHSGILVAQQLGWFANADLELELISVEVDNYCAKPVEKVLDGEAHLCIGPTEHLFKYGQDVDGKPLLQAVATIMQQDMSAFATLKSSGVNRPADLDGKLYLAYQTPLETEILQAMIRFDGGEGKFEFRSPARLELWHEFIASKGDVCWIFKPWEAALAAREGIKLNLFSPSEFGVPYGYTSLFMASVNRNQEEDDAMKAFIQVAERGYQFVVQETEKALELLCKQGNHANFADKDLIQLGLTLVSSALLDKNGRWGTMELDRFEIYAQFLAGVKPDMRLPSSMKSLVETGLRF